MNIDLGGLILTGLCCNMYCRVGHAVAQLVEALRYKFVGSIPDRAIGIFH
jgi:hypothetical protein